MFNKGVKWSPRDDRDYRFGFTGAVQQNNDLSNLMRDPVRNQGQRNSCTAYAGTQGLEALRIKDGLPVDRHLSTAFMYAMTRKIDGDFPADNGATMRAACQSLVDYGCCWEDEFYQDDVAIDQMPGPDVLALASQNRLKAYYRVQGTGTELLNGMLGALTAGFPLYVAFKVYPSFENIGPSGVAPMHGPGELTLGGHAGLFYQSFADQSFVKGGCFRDWNSWGDGFGDDGKVLIPWGWVFDGTIVEVWVLSQELLVTPVPLPVDPSEDTMAQIHGLGVKIVELSAPPDPAPPPEPDPAPPEPQAAFIAPVPAGAVYGRTKWLPGSLGVDLFCPRGTRVVAPADCVVEEVIPGEGISGGAEVIVRGLTGNWAMRGRHVQDTVQVGDRVAQGELLALVGDNSLDRLGPVPGWAGPMPDGWQHLDFSWNVGTDRFSPQGGGGGNVDGFDVLQAWGYQGRVLDRTPGPPDAGVRLDDAVQMMTPKGRRTKLTQHQVSWYIGVGVALAGVALSFILSHPDDLGLGAQGLAWLGVLNAVLVVAAKIAAGGWSPPEK